MKNVEDFSAASKEFFDDGLKSFSLYSKNMQTIATESAEYAKKSMEANTGFVEKVFAAKSVDKAMEIQSEFAKSAYEDFVAQATRFGELYTDLAKESFKPVERAFTKAK